jgi:hypothetical protein
MPHCDPALDPAVVEHREHVAHMGVDPERPGKLAGATATTEVDGQRGRGRATDRRRFVRERARDRHPRLAARGDAVDRQHQRRALVRGSEPDGGE